jgi:exonuclease 3'-5' domain-containing protein 1
MAYTLCTSERDLATALQTLSQSQHLVLDCEGRELGMQGGALSLISIGTAEGDSVFLIDTISIPRGTPAICDLVALLGRADVHKLMWDGRQDGIALREAYGVVLKGVVDMQLAEVVSRGAARGEDNEARLKRLIHLIGGKVLHTRNSYLEVHCLAGLDSSLKQFNVGLEHTKSGMSQLHATGARIAHRFPFC